MKPLTATKGIIIIFLVLSFVAGGLSLKLKSLSQPKPQVNMVATYAPVYIDVETPTPKPRVINKPVDSAPAAITPVPAQTKQKTSGSKAVFIPPPTPKPPYPVCTVYYPSSKVTLTYTTFSPSECSAEQAKASTYTNSGYTVPDVAGQAQQQFDHVNDNLQNFEVTTPAPTQNPCGNLQGNVNIVGGNCE